MLIRFALLDSLEMSTATSAPDHIPVLVGLVYLQWRLLRDLLAVHEQSLDVAGYRLVSGFDSLFE